MSGPPARNERLRRAFEEVLEASTDEQRERVLARIGEEDAALAAEVRHLFAAAPGASPLDRPPVGAALRRWLEEERPERTPTSIGGYRVRGVLGRGASGTVYEAESGDPPRTVAVKVLRAGAATASVRRRFALEAELLGRLDHPNVARILDAGVVDSELGPSPYLVMEHVSGAPLDRFLARRGLGRRERIELVLRICRGVEHAHGRGVIHRDLKPGNILVSDDGVPHLVDFGVARVLTDEPGRSSMHTAAGALLGTLPYMSPEQAAGDPSATDVRSDVYSLGVIAFEVLTGRLPIELARRGVAASVDRIVNAPPRRLSSIDADLRGDLEVVVATALEKDPARRYATVAEFSRDLRCVLDDEPISARAPGPWVGLRRLARRHRPLAAAAALALASLLLGAAAAGVGLLRARDEATNAARSLEGERAAHAAARRALDRAERSVGFLTGLLRSVDPRRLGRAVELTDLLDQAEGSVDDAFADEPLVAADLRIQLTRAYRMLGEYASAERALAPAIETWAAAGLGDRAETRVARGMLAVLRRKLGRVDEARRILEELVPAAADPDRIDRVALSLADLPFAAELASTYALAGRSEDALRIRRRCAAVAAAAPTLPAVQRVEYGCKLAISLIAARRFEEAAGLLEELRAREIDRVGEEHADVRYVETYLADVLGQTGRHREAEEIYRRSARAMAALHGDRHPRTRAAWMRLAKSVGAQGREDEAIGILRLQLAQAAADAPDSISRLEVLQKFGEALARSGRADDAREAVPLLVEYLERSSASLGRVDLDHVRTLTSLAFAHAALGDAAEAERRIGQAEAAFAAAGGGAAWDGFAADRAAVWALLEERW